MMPSWHFAPPKLAGQLRRRLQQAAAPVYAQCGSITWSGNTPQPALRTVHLRYVTEFKTLGFVTCTTSDKWRQLHKQPQLAICFYDPVASIQWRISGKADLIKAPQHAKTMQRLWRQIRPSLHQVYWQSLPSKALQYRTNREMSHHVAPHFGLVLISVQSWEIFKMQPHDYAKSQRWLYQRRGQQWRAQRLELLR